MVKDDYRWLQVIKGYRIHLIARRVSPYVFGVFQESNKLFVEAFAHGTNSEAQTMISKDLLKIVLVNAHVEA